VAARELPPSPGRTSPRSKTNVRNRLIATGAALLGGLETLAFLVVICSR
jgi:hypothetical protein